MLPIRTLDGILAEAGAPTNSDFLSDRCGGSRNRGAAKVFDIARWRPQLVLLGDHVLADLSKHRYLTAAGYRSIRRYENNGWYVPRESAAIRRWSDRMGGLAQILFGAAIPECCATFQSAFAKPIKVLTSRRIALPAGGCQPCVSSWRLA